MQNKKLIYIAIGVFVLVVAFAALRFSMLPGIKRQLLQLEMQEEALELEYRTGRVSFEQFSSKKIEIEVREEQLERIEDLLELDF